MKGTKGANKHTEEGEPVAAAITKYHGFIRKLEKSNMESDELKQKLKKHQRKLAPEEVKRLRTLINNREKAEEAKLRSTVEALQKQVRANEEAKLAADSKRSLKKEKPQLKSSSLLTKSEDIDSTAAMAGVADPRKASTTSPSTVIDDYLGVLSPSSSTDSFKKKSVLSPNFTPRKIVVKSLTSSTSSSPTKSLKKDSVLQQTPPATPTNIKATTKLKSSSSKSSISPQNLPTSPPSILDLLPPPPPPPPTSKHLPYPSTPSHQRPLESMKHPASSPLVSPSSLSATSSPTIPSWKQLQQHKVDGKRLSLSEYHKRKPKGAESMMMESEYLAFLESIGDEPPVTYTNNNNKQIKAEPVKNEITTTTLSSFSLDKEEKPMVYSSPPSMDSKAKVEDPRTQTTITPSSSVNKLNPFSPTLSTTTVHVLSPVTSHKKPKSILVTSKSLDVQQQSPQHVTSPTMEPAQKHVRISEESPSKTAQNILSLLGPRKDSSFKKDLSTSMTKKQTNEDEVQLHPTKKKKPGFLCGECSKSFANFVDLEIHVNEKHTNIETINKIDVNPHNSIRVPKLSVIHSKKVVTAAPTVQFTKIKKTPPAVLENPDKVKVHYAPKKPFNNDSTTTTTTKQQNTTKASQHKLSSKTSKKLSEHDIKQELARIRELRERQRAADNAATQDKKKSKTHHQNGTEASPSTTKHNNHQQDVDKEKSKVKSLSKKELKEREWRIEQKRLKKKKRKEKERALKLKELMDSKMKEGSKKIKTKNKESDKDPAEKSKTIGTTESPTSQMSASDGAPDAASQKDEITSGGDSSTTIVVGKRQSKQTQRKKAFMDALKARQSRRKQMQEFVLSENNETPTATPGLTIAGFSKVIKFDFYLFS